MARRPRLAAQAAAASLRTPIPTLPDDEDEEMLDAPGDEVGTPRDDEDDEPDEAEDDDGQEENEDGATPARESEAPSRSATPRRPGRGSAIPRKRNRFGRPRVKPVASDDDAAEGGSDAGTPRRRGAARARGVGRWGKPRGGPSRVTHAPLDQEGNTLEIVDDEVQLPEDPEGETKIDKYGYLQNGREYRVRTFTIIGRGKRLYMLSTEPARCIGFRDSYLFFQKHKQLYKIIIDDEEKRDLIERDLIPHSYKGRAIGVVTARSVFREFGSRIVIGGKLITDDYDVAGARERGDAEGELAVPEDTLPPPGQPYNRNQYVAWHGASSVYHTGVPSVPLPNGKLVDGKKRKVTVTSDNWMLEHARASSQFNSNLSALRKDVSRGLYDIHTNSMHWPRTLQPTHARWEAVEEDKEKPRTNEVDVAIKQIEEPTTSRSTLAKLDPVYTRNFRIHDLCLESAPESNLGPPGMTEDPSSLLAVPTHILDELPPECLQAFEDARGRELAWKSKWLTESVDGMRARFLPAVAWFP